MKNKECAQLDISYIRDIVKRNLEYDGRLIAINGYIDKNNNNVVVYILENNKGRESYKIIGEEKIPTISDIYPIAQWFEEEIEEMMPLKFIGLNVKRRFLLPEEFTIGEGQILIMPLDELKKLKSN